MSDESLLHAVMDIALQELVKVVDNDEKWLANITTMYQSKVYRASVIEDVLTFKRKFPSKSLKSKLVIDFGCGAGISSLMLASLGYQVKALEYSGTWVDGPPQNEVNFQVHQYQKAHNTIMQSFLEYSQNISFNLYSSMKELEEFTLEPSILFMSAVWEHLSDSVKSDLKESLLNGRNFESIYICKLPRFFSYQERLARFCGINSHSNLYTKRKIQMEFKNTPYKITWLELDEVLPNYPLGIANRLFMLRKNVFLGHLFRILKPMSHDFRIKLDLENNQHRATS